MKFEKQTYTQTPNSLFVEMKDMDECELKVVMLICRYTFGYHRDEVKLSTRRIADEIGMNTASVQKGADKAIERGLIEKVIDGNKTTTWRALVSDSEIESPMIQKLNRGVSDNESQSRVKESNKEKEIKTFSFSAKDKEQNDAKMNYILANSRQSESSTAWRGRELLGDNYLPYGDWWHSKTGLHMYGAKAKAKVDTEWLNAFKAWYEFEITIPALDEAYQANEWRKVSKPSQITADAKLVQAAPKKTDVNIEPKFKNGSGYV